MRTWKTWTGLLILALALTACGDDEQQGAALQAVGDRDASVASAATTAEIAGAFVYAQGPRLFYYDAQTGGEPILLSDSYTLQRIALSPGRDTIIFENDDLGNGTAHVIDVAARTARDAQTALSSSAATTWGVASWSPDGAWTVNFMWPLGFEAVKLDGSASFELPINQDGFSGWLEDGSLLLVDRDFRTDATVYLGVYRLDVNSGVLSEWPFNEADLQENFNSTLEALVAANGYAFAEAQGPRGVGVAINAPPNWFSFTNAADLCENWQFVSTGETPELLYETPAFKITDFQILDSGDWLYLQWDLPDCRISKAPVVSLVTQTPGGEPRMITDQIFTAVDYSRARLNTGNTGRYSLAPDQQSVAWVSGSPDAPTSAINITDLASGDTTTLLAVDRGDTNPDAFLNNMMYKAVFWVTP